MSYQFKHSYWGEEFIDAKDLHPTHRAFSSAGVARAVARIFFYETADTDPSTFETYVEVKDEFGVIRKYQVTSEVEISFTAHEHEG